MRRCLCVFSRILGWGVFGGFVAEALAAHSAKLDFRYVEYGADALALRVPWYRNIGDHSSTQWRLRQLIRTSGVAASEYQAFLFQGHDVAVPFRREFAKPAGIICDTTPAITKRRASWQGGARAVGKRVWSELQDRAVYRPMFASTAAFLALSDFAANSLCSDYGVAPDRIFPIGLPVYEAIAALPKPEKQERPVLLFVGNDFVRKGGSFLLELYRRHFADRADLWIVSNGFSAAGLEAGIRAFSNLPHSAVLELMLRSHVFLFPSYHDELGLVLAEAACAGLPIVARESGGQGEYVRSGENGFLLPLQSDLHAWRAAIDEILASDELRLKFSAGSAALGRRLCSKARFDSQVTAFLDRMLAGSATAK